MHTSSKPNRIAGWVLLGLVGGIMGLASGGKLLGFGPPEVIEGLQEANLHDDMLLIGLAELVSAVLLLIPRTSSAGILLVSAFWGGAIVSHMTKDESFALPAVLLILAWIGSWLRDPRVLSSFFSERSE